MKGKRRHGGGNPLSEYRRIQREIRVIYDPFTAKHCPTCATPCCVKPTRVTPIDVALAVGTGHAFPHLAAEDPYAAALDYGGKRLSPSTIPLHMAEQRGEWEYCDYLNNGRCTFPNDLRPYGCTTFICDPMYAHLPAETIRRLRRLLRQLEETHFSLIRALRDSGRYQEEEE